ncbi:MAG: DUF4097 domain-containing protein [Ruminococcaceae bacterium]|jgi:hypothetical protein|nr:DUF4097 domain-containing protein [Oscillospiraceae bacterium]
MKRTGLIVLIVICLVVFIATLAGGILLTINNIGWQDLLDESRLQEHVQKITQNINIQSWLPGKRTAFTIDESIDLDLSKIRSIDLSTVSESITVLPVTGKGQARLNGNYTAATPLRFEAAIQGDTLHIKPEYPRLGIFFSDLHLTVEIPDTFDGDLSIYSVSGEIQLPGTSAKDWQNIDLKTISGGIKADRADYSQIRLVSVSGRVDLGEISAKVDCRTTSGSIKLDYATFQDTTVKSVSGTVDIMLPAQTDVSVRYATVSGSFSDQDLPLVGDSQNARRYSGKMGDGHLLLDVDTTSGSLHLVAR